MLVCAPWAKHRALLASLTPTEATRCRPLGPGVTRGHWPVGPHGFAPPRLPGPQRPRRASTHPATPLPCPAPGPAASPPRALCFPGGGCRPGVSSIPVSDTGGSRQTAGAAAPPPGTAGGGGGAPGRLCRLPPAGPLPSCTLLLVPTRHLRPELLCHPRPQPSGTPEGSRVAPGTLHVAVPWGPAGRGSTRPWLFSNTRMCMPMSPATDSVSGGQGTPRAERLRTFPSPEGPTQGGGSTAAGVRDPL